MSLITPSNPFSQSIGPAPLIVRHRAQTIRVLVTIPVRWTLLLGSHCGFLRALQPPVVSEGMSTHALRLLVADWNRRGWRLCLGLLVRAAGKELALRHAVRRLCSGRREGSRRAGIPHTWMRLFFGYCSDRRLLKAYSLFTYTEIPTFVPECSSAIWLPNRRHRRCIP